MQTRMRIGTWNLAGRWGHEHLAALTALDCDVLLLTEVSERVEIAGMTGHTGQLFMAARRRWAGVWSRWPMTPLPDPHGASAMVEIGGLRFCSSILPWRSCGDREPWVGTNTAERTIEAVDAVRQARPDVWGGDWNHALRGREHAGSRAGRDHVLGALELLGLRAATTDAPHQIEGLVSIDHVALPVDWEVAVEHHTALRDGYRLSDHDAYVVTATPATPASAIS